ncbi:MAG: ABC transporter ATP-binding protein [Oscillospiraceae bacterium]|nr:ABC transporter ATP-binding protein [Oscillospiraceae bacterium]
MALMTIKDLEKSYTGTQALRGIHLELETGKIVGLLGPNTAGKTTLLKTIAGLLRPDRGEIIYPGGATGRAAKNTVSLLPDQSEFPSWMRVIDAFTFYQNMYSDYSEQKAAEMVSLLELPLEMKIRRMSKGMQERVALGLTFSRLVPLYLLDEPLGGIDPMGKHRIMQSILSMDLAQSSILLSTHLVRDVETLFDSILLISQGEIIYTGDCEEIRAQQGKTVEQIYVEVFSGVK